MCGIFACMGVVNAGKKIYKGLKSLEYRGYDSWGIAVSTQSGIYLNKNVGFLPSSRPQLPISNYGIGHTRWATHGGVTHDNSHPHLDCTEYLSVVHNGIVENWKELKQSLSNHKFRSETDTEIIVHFLENQLRNGLSLTESVQKLVKKIAGYNAFVVMDHSSSTIIAYRKGSPLTLGKHNNEYYLSSDLPTLHEHVNRYYPLEDGHIVVINPGSCKLIQDGELISIPWEKSPNIIGEIRKIKTKYHMESEIFESIDLVPITLSRLAPQTKKLKQLVSMSQHTIIVGCGSSYYASILASTVLQKQGYLSSAVVASDGDSLLSTINNQTLVIAISQSGETIDTLEYVQACKNKGATVIAVVNVLGSTLDRTAMHSVYLNTGIETAVASTKAFFYMLFVFLTLFDSLDVVGVKKLHNSLKQLVSTNQRMAHQKLANKLINLKHVFVLGKGHLYPIALEFALKLKEICYLHAEAISVGELKHGPLALITKGSVCIALSDSHVSRDIKTAASEIQARGGKVIILDAPDLEFVSPLYHTILAHLLSFELSLIRKINPDRPRNLAKSVTVK